MCCFVVVWMTMIDLWLQLKIEKKYKLNYHYSRSWEDVSFAVVPYDVPSDQTATRILNKKYKTVYVLRVRISTVLFCF